MILTTLLALTLMGGGQGTQNASQRSILQIGGKGTVVISSPKGSRTLIAPVDYAAFIKLRPEETIGVTGTAFVFYEQNGFLKRIPEVGFPERKAVADEFIRRKHQSSGRPRPAVEVLGLDEQRTNRLVAVDGEPLIISWAAMKDLTIKSLETTVDGERYSEPPQSSKRIGKLPVHFALFPGTQRVLLENIDEQKDIPVVLTLHFDHGVKKQFNAVILSKADTESIKKKTNAFRDAEPNGTIPALNDLLLELSRLDARSYGAELATQSLGANPGSALNAIWITNYDSEILESAMSPNRRTLTVHFWKDRSVQAMAEKQFKKAWQSEKCQALEVQEARFEFMNANGELYDFDKALSPAASLKTDEPVVIVLISVKDKSGSSDYIRLKPKARSNEKPRDVQVNLALWEGDCEERLYLEDYVKDKPNGEGG